MKKLSLLFALAISVATMFADPVKIGNLYYNLDDENRTAEVAEMPSGKYSGTINVPATVTSDASVTYDVTSIASRAFYGCSNLTKVTIPNSIVTVGEYAFYDCPELESIVYNDHVFAHLPQSYSGIYSIPEGIELIAGGSFFRCKDLTTIEIPGSVTTIGKSGPFYKCPSLTAINVAKNNTVYCSEGGVLYSKDKTVLIACPNGKSGNFSVPNSVKTIGEDAFAACEKLQKISLPYQLTLIDKRAFFNATALSAINIPNTVTTIEEYAFSYCQSLESAIIGSGLKSIGTYAFLDCIALASITCKAVTPPVCASDAVFKGVDKTIPLYVPKNSVEVYIRTEAWKLFKNNTHAIESAVDNVSQASEIKSNKVMQNGVLYIEKNGELFNLNGARVK